MLGDAKEALGDHDASMKHWNEALSLWKKLDEKEKAARIHRKMANVLLWVMDDKENAEKHCQEALKILEALPKSAELASLYSDRAWMQWYVGDLDTARACAEKAIELAEQLDAKDIVAHSYSRLGVIIRFRGDAKRAIECGEKGLKTALDNNCLKEAVMAYNSLAMSLPMTEWRRCQECLEKGHELAKKVGDIWYQCRIGNNMTSRMIFAGDIGKALPLAEENLALARKAGQLSNISSGLRSFGYVHMLLGEYDKGERYYQESWSIAERSKNFQQMSNSMFAFGWMCLSKEEYANAAEWLERLSAHYKGAGAESEFPEQPYASWLISAYIELGEIEKANNQIDILRKSAPKRADDYLVLASNALEAMVLRAQKKWEESIKLFEKALEQARTLDLGGWHRYFIARMVLFEYARVYLERDQEGDREKAHSLLNQALEIFQKIGAKRMVEKVIAKKKLLTA